MNKMEMLLRVSVVLGEASEVLPRFEAQKARRGALKRTIDQNEKELRRFDRRLR